MKKNIALILAITLLILCFTGCSGNDAPTTEPSDSVATTAPSDPTEATEATDPSETTEATEATDPSEATDATEPAATVAPTQPAATTAPSEPAGATEPAATVAPTQPAATTAPHSHSYGNWKVTKKATCTEKGSQTRSCSCGDTQTEAIAATGHNYVNNVCSACGHENFAHGLTVLDGVKADSVFIASDKVITYQTGDKCYLADHTGKLLTSKGYDGINCANPDGYVVVYTYKKEVLETFEEDELTLEKSQYEYDCYVLDAKGAVVFQTKYSFLEVEMDKTTYSGEYIAFVNEDRIVTYTSDTYYFPTAGSNKTVNIYDMKGNRLAQFTDIWSMSTFMNGKMFLFKEEGVAMVVDQNGKVKSTSAAGAFDQFYYHSFASRNWTYQGFINGYIMLTDGYSETRLYDETLSKVYRVPQEYIVSSSNNGTLVAARIKTSSGVSEECYLIDLAKCQKDAEGYSIPTIDAAVSRQGYDSMEVARPFGRSDQYILVSRDGKWGYLKMDGSMEKLYDDAGSFYNGKAIVKDGDQIYVIDQNFKRISNAITGYDGVATVEGNVFIVRKGDVEKIAVLN